MKIPASTLPVSEELFRQKLAEYSTARDAHAFTKNVPAPLPEFEVFREIYEKKKVLEVIPDEVVEVSAEPKNLIDLILKHPDFEKLKSALKE